jgi:hypothetical protein
MIYRGVEQVVNHKEGKHMDRRWLQLILRKPLDPVAAVDA